MFYVYLCSNFVRSFWITITLLEKKKKWESFWIDKADMVHVIFKNISKYFVFCLGAFFELFYCTYIFGFPLLYTYFSVTFNIYKYIWKAKFLFLTLSNKVEKYYAFGLSVCPSVQAFTFVNILQISSNLHMLFIFDIEWNACKMVCKGLSVRLQRYTKVFRCITAYGGGDF